jgi:hypothetical protein
MRRGRLFFIGLLSAIVTIVSLNIALGRPGYYYKGHSFYNRYHHCYGYDRHYRDDKNYQNEKRRQADSSNSNY